jgi:hypothetical protein
MKQRITKLIQANKGTVKLFRDLCQEAQLALIQYMALDGEAWELAPGIDKIIDQHQRHLRKRPSKQEVTKKNKALAKCLPFYIKMYGKAKFGYVAAVPMAALVEEIMRDANRQRDWTHDWKQYHDWYMGKSTNSAKPKHGAPAKQPWPVILSSFNDETLEDGWTRFHQYAERKMATCPAVWFPQQHKKM